MNSNSENQGVGKAFQVKVHMIIFAMDMLRILSLPKQ